MTFTNVTNFSSKGEGEKMTLGVADLKHYFDNIIVISLIMGITYICKYGVIVYTNYK